jgi:hypothetical protein
MNVLEVLGGLLVSVGLPVLFFVCFAVAVWRRSTCPIWVPIVAAVPFLLLTVIVPIAQSGAGLPYALFGLLVGACFVLSAIGIDRGLRWRLIPLFVGLVVAAPAMAVVALTSLAGLPSIS